MFSTYNVNSSKEGAPMEEGANLAKAKTTNGSPMSTTSTTSKTSQTREEECLEEGGEIMPDQADKTTPSSLDTGANLATRRQNVGRRKVSRLSQSENLPTTPQIPTKTSVVECW